MRLSGLLSDSYFPGCTLIKSFTCGHLVVLTNQTKYSCVVINCSVTILCSENLAIINTVYSLMYNNAFLDFIVEK